MRGSCRPASSMNFSTSLQLALSVERKKSWSLRTFTYRCDGVMEWLPAFMVAGQANKQRNHGCTRLAGDCAAFPGGVRWTNCVPPPKFSTPRQMTDGSPILNPAMSLLLADETDARWMVHVYLLAMSPKFTQG